MGTITVTVDDETEKKFRKIVGKTFGEKKGSLGQATTEAMRIWIEQKSQDAIAAEALTLLQDGGHRYGRRLYKNRRDLYDRTARTD